MNTKQCAKCPWRKDVDPHDIPTGYSETKHRALESTIADQGGLGGLADFLNGTVRMMACHESPVGEERPCVGWLANQMGPGNNIGLRLWASANLRTRLALVGEQHERFEDTLPKKRRKKRKPARP